MRKNFIGFSPLVLIFVVGALALIGFFIFREPDSKNQDQPSVIQKISEEITPKSTPFLFEETTIPYLRNREFKSNLGDLAKYADNGNFTSYLTNYDSDGLKINGLLTIPNGNRPESGWPAIVFVHGYIAPTIYRTTERYSDHVNYLARNGFVVFKIDLRGHGNSEGEPGGAYYSSDYIIDTLNAYAALQNVDFVNPNAIGLWGHSMAGNVTFKSFVVNQHIPAIVIWAGAGYTYTDLQQYRISDNSYRPPEQNTERARKRQLLRDTYGEFDQNHTFWKQIVGTNYLEGVNGSLQLHHAASDDVVSVEYSRNLVNVLENTSISHELFEYPSGGHNLTGGSFSSAMERTVEFFKNHLR